MRKSFKNIIVLLFAAFAVAFQMFPMESRAEGEEVYFGSESYSWTIYEESPVGIYVESSEGISEVDMIVTYEPDMIEYSSGGTLAEEGRIEINASAGGVTQYQTMLNFIPQAGGSSEITIESASITTSEGNTYELDPVTVTESVTVPDMCQLEDIQINGESLPDFNSRQTEYSIEVGADVTEADVTVAPSDADVQISDTSLEVGENVITVVSTDLWDHDARYRTIRISINSRSDRTGNGRSDRTGDNGTDGDACYTGILIGFCHAYIDSCVNCYSGGYFGSIGRAESNDCQAQPEKNSIAVKEIGFSNGRCSLMKSLKMMCRMQKASIRTATVGKRHSMGRRDSRESERLRIKCLKTVKYQTLFLKILN